MIARAVTIEGQSRLPETGDTFQIALSAPSPTASSTEAVPALPIRKKAVVAPSPVGSVQRMVEKEFGAGSIMVGVAHAESHFDPHADNPTSTAYGVFQILIGTWNSYHCQGDRGNAYDNIQCARKIYDAEGTAPWNSSRAMW